MNEINVRDIWKYMEEKEGRRGEGGGAVNFGYEPVFAYPTFFKVGFLTNTPFGRVSKITPSDCGSSIRRLFADSFKYCHHSCMFASSD